MSLLSLLSSDSMISIVSKCGEPFKGETKVALAALQVPILTMEQIPEFLNENVTGRIRGLEYDETPIDVPEDYKWKLISALQKTIRRGDVATSLGLAKALNGINSAYLWRRLRIITFEDIGAINPIMLAVVAHLSVKKNRNRFGDVRALLWVVEELCKAVKDRTACDISNLAMYTKQWRTAIKTHETASLEEMRANLLNNPFDDGITYKGLMQDFIMLRMFTGDAPSPYASLNDKYPIKREASPNQTAKLLDEIGTTDFHRHIFYSSAKVSEGMNPAIPVMFREFKNLREWEVVEEKNEAHCDGSDFIDNLPAYAYDGHTLEGKKAFSYWLKSHWGKTDLFKKVPEKLWMQLLKSMVFHGEGTKMNFRVMTDLSTTILREQRVYNAGYYGLTYEEFMYLVKETERNIEQLNAIRRKVA